MFQHACLGGRIEAHRNHLWGSEHRALNQRGMFQQDVEPSDFQSLALIPVELPPGRAAPIDQDA